jgi:hypothetical protein
MFVKSYHSIRCYPSSGIKTLVLRAGIRDMDILGDAPCDPGFIVKTYGWKGTTSVASWDMERRKLSSNSSRVSMSTCIFRLTRATTSCSRTSLGHISPPELLGSQHLAICSVDLTIDGRVVDVARVYASLSLYID